MLKFFLMLMGAVILAPLVIAGLVVAIPALPFLIAGWVIYKVVRARLSRRSMAIPEEDRWIALQLRGYSMPIAPFALGALATASLVQIKLSGFSWHVDLWFGGAILLVAGLWWVQHRIVNRRRKRLGHGASGVAQHDLYRLFEIERTADADERLILIARELNRLTLESLRADPTFQETWPSVMELKAVRDQVRVLRACLNDPVTRNRHETEYSGPFRPMELRSGIDSLDSYLSQFLRVRLIGHHDLEQLRIMVRDQSSLRGMQDAIVERFQQVTPVAIASETSCARLPEVGPRVVT